MLKLVGNTAQFKKLEKKFSNFKNRSVNLGCMAQPWWKSAKAIESEQFSEWQELRTEGMILFNYL